MFQDIETFRAFAASLQSCAVVLAVFIGGIWTAYVFWIKRRSAVGIDICAKQLPIPNEKLRHILISLTMTNKGTRDTRLVWKKEPIILAKLTVSVQKHPSLEFVSSTPISFMSDSKEAYDEVSTGIRPGDSKKYEVVVIVDTPGMYQVLFIAEPQREHISIRNRAKGPIKWKAMCYVVIE